MPVQTACSSCSAKIKVKDELIGKSIKCPKCKKVFKVEAEEEAKTSLKAGSASKTAPQKPPAAWDDGDEDEEVEEKSPWDKKSGSKKDEDDAPKGKSKAKPPSKKTDDDDEADDDDDEKDEDASFSALLNQTLLSPATKKMIQGELSLREQGVWVGQPCPKIAAVRAIGKALGGIFGVTILCVILGVGGGAALEKNWYFAAAGAALIWLVLTPIIGFGVPFMDRRKAQASAYVITNKRCIVFTGHWISAPTQESFYPDLLAHMRRMSSWIFGADSGDIVFRSVTTITTTHSQKHGTSTSVTTTYYGFLGIRNLDDVERMIRQTLLSDDDDDDDDDEDEKPKRKKKR